MSASSEAYSSWGRRRRSVYSRTTQHAVIVTAPLDVGDMGSRASNKAIFSPPLSPPGALFGERVLTLRSSS